MQVIEGTSEVWSVCQRSVNTSSNLRDAPIDLDQGSGQDNRPSATALGALPRKAPAVATYHQMSHACIWILLSLSTEGRKLPTQHTTQQ